MDKQLPPNAQYVFDAINEFSNHWQITMTDEDLGYDRYFRLEKYDMTQQRHYQYNLIVHDGAGMIMEDELLNTYRHHLIPISVHSPISRKTIEYQKARNHPAYRQLMQMVHYYCKHHDITINTETDDEFDAYFNNSATLIERIKEFIYLQNMIEEIQNTIELPTEP